MVTITQEQNTICSKPHLDGTMHEQTIVCGQLLAGHAVGYCQKEGRKNCIE